MPTGIFGRAFFITSVLLAGCGVFNSNQIESELSNCARVQRISLPTYDHENQLIIFLVEGNDEYQSRVLHSWFNLEEVFLDVFGPNDRLIGVWMEVSQLSLTEALFFDDFIKDIPVPTIIDEPAPELRPTPGLERTPSVAGRQQAENVLTSIDEENQRIVNEHYCKEILPLRRSQNEKINEHVRDQEAEKIRVVSNFINELGSENPNIMSVFEALNLASAIFEELCGSEKFDKCSLLILSDMEDWRVGYSEGQLNVSIENMNINFEEVDIGVIWFDCTLFFGSCAERRQNWEKHFQEFQNNDVQFFNAFSSLEDIANFLED